MSSASSDSSRDLERISLGQITPGLQASIRETLGYPVIQLIVDNDYAGSGILVEIDGIFGILTAEHVVFKRIKGGRVLATIPAIYPIERANDPKIQPDVVGIYISCLNWYPEQPHSEDYADAEWGPDLAFIPIPEQTGFWNQLRIRRNYSDLTRAPESRLEKALDQNNTVLAIVGAPGVWVTADPVRRLGLEGKTAVCGVLVTAQEEYVVAENGYDFVDAIASREPGALVPERFGGVSGGALWRLRDPFHADPPMLELKSEDYVLAGVIFWGDHRDPKPFFRAHGPRSLYKKFLPEVRAWPKLRTRRAT